MDTLRLGRTVAAARRAGGLTQVELAVAAGTTQPVISRLESGRVVPDLDLLDRLATAMGAPLTITLGATEPITDEERRRRITRIMGEKRFDPWSRDPSPAEIDSLQADGIQQRG